MSGRCVDKMKEPQLSLFLDNIHAEILQFVNSIRLYSLQRLWHLLSHLCRSFFPELMSLVHCDFFFAKLYLERWRNLLKDDTDRECRERDGV